MSMRRILLAIAAVSAAATAQQWNFLDGPAYSGKSAAFDWSRGRLVVFGDDGDTWEFEGTQMLHRAVPAAPGSAPSPRTRSAIVYDFGHARMLLFGGYGNGAALGDTWAWDGRSWTQLAGTSPTARMDAAITYDLVRNRAVLFGGQVPFVGVASDTWEHDGNSWIQRAPATVPTPINSPVIGYDLTRLVTVMVTHAAVLGASVVVWEWDGTNWVSPPTGVAAPTTTGNEGLAYDPSRGRVTLIGGVPDASQVWEWDGSSWQQTATIAEPLRLDPAVYFDTVRGHIVVAGGTDFRMVNGSTYLGSAHTDAWVWDGTAMTNVRVDQRPPNRYGHAWFSDFGRNRLVLFGGMRQQTPVDETWIFDGNTWAEMQPAARPPARIDAAATYDWQHGVDLLFGGFALGNQFNDLWHWDGGNWTLLANTGPSARSAPGLCHDLARGVTVLFGGSTGPVYLPSSLNNETWEWNGTSWTQRLLALAPSPRERPAMDYDFARSRVVLFGGRTDATAASQLADTWEWDGTAWQLMATPHAPPPLLEPSLHFDLASTGHMLLTGSIQVGSVWHLQAWQYDGLDWTQLADNVGSQLTGGRTAIEPVRLLPVLSNGTVLAEWTHQPARVDDFGTGCGAPSTMIGSRARPRLGEPSCGVETNVGPGEPVFFGVAVRQGSTPLGNGCTLLLAGTTAIVFTAADSKGAAQTTFAVPAVTALRGVQVFAQAAVLDPAAPGGLRLSQGLRLTVGD
jgi:hypothetical protein